MLRKKIIGRLTKYLINITQKKRKEKMERLIKIINDNRDMSSEKVK